MGYLIGYHVPAAPAYLQAWNDTPCVTDATCLAAVPHRCVSALQVSVLPGGVFRWGKDQLEVKPTRERPQASTTDGWQLLGALQYDDTGVSLCCDCGSTWLLPSELMPVVSLPCGDQEAIIMLVY